MGTRPGCGEPDRRGRTGTRNARDSGATGRWARPSHPMPSCEPTVAVAVALALMTHVQMGLSSFRLVSL